MSPYIISVSRREDIPAFKSKWFIDKLKEGKINIKGSYKSYDINFENTKFAVFWSKNPEPLIKYIDEIPFKYYFQFTLNYYPEYELNIPKIEDRIETFKKLSDKIGKDKVIWRFDPIIINDIISEKEIIKRINFIGDQIYQYTEKMVFSYVDPYKKLKNTFFEIDNSIKISISKSIIELNNKWNLILSTCSENKIEGINKNQCIDPNLIEKICGEQEWIKNKKDSNQRSLCGCIISTDIGEYKQCKHQCLYCYAS